MLINGIELSSLGVSLHNRVLSSNKVKTVKKWADGSLEPTIIRQQDSFKTITLQFLIGEQNEENAFIVMSNLTMLLKKAIIIFDDMPEIQFDVTLDGETKQERLKNGNFLLTAKLKSDYAKGENEVHTTDTAATDSFNLSIVYYKDNNHLITTESIKVKSSDFIDKENITFEDLGIRINKYQETYYKAGVVTNFHGILTYENLYNVGTLIINYSPTTYFKDVDYFLWNGVSYDLVNTVTVSFTYFQIQSYTSIGQLINFNLNRPTGYKATCKFNQDFNFENIVNFGTNIPIYYDPVESEKTKEIRVRYYKEVDNTNVLINDGIAIIRETDVVEGSTLGSIFDLNKFKPQQYYTDGYNKNIDKSTIVTFDSLEEEYDFYYDLEEKTIYIEYHNGTYPNWIRVNTDTLTIKYKEEYADAENIFEALNININKYKTNYYNDGLVFNPNIYNTYDDIINVGVVQIYYVPKEYTLTVKYIQQNGDEITELQSQDYTLTDMMFTSEPKLGNIISINAYRPDGYEYNDEESYVGEVSLPALITASPISIVYTPVEVVKTKSVVIKYYKQLANTMSVINTSVITVTSADVGGGIRLKDLFDINKYQPEYYNTGIIDGYSLDTFVSFEEIDGIYDIYYYASTYSTQVRYYTDEIAIENWIGSSNISYTVLSFDKDTTLVSLGLDLNAYKPSYGKDGEIQPIGGPITFATLVNLSSINIIYESQEEPDDPSGIDYPHRILFLQHNDSGPTPISGSHYMSISWTMNHAYINTGVIADDISETTVSVSAIQEKWGHRLYRTNPPYAYLFGAKGSAHNMYIGYYNYKYPYDSSHSADCYYIAEAGDSLVSIVDKDPEMRTADEPENGFTRNTGIYASERVGVSFLTLKHTQTIPTSTGSTEVPLYLFACNNRGNYQGGISAVGIAGCKIYKNNVLVRDFIPVQYYDLIGTQVAPSNCLYDKVTQTFFEDATGLKSFNIMDDDEYEDTNPLHKIGKIYINYYKEGGFFQNRVIYFRGNEITNGTFDLDKILDIEAYQPRFYGAGTYTTTATDLRTFEGLNNAVFEVNYPKTGYYITMNYYKDNINTSNLLGSDRVYLTEDMFYQVPTFGQLFDLLKYKPEGYKLKQEDIPYKQEKVTLERILQSQPYDVVYTECPEPNIYNFVVKYYKHKNVIDPKHPLNQYELIAAPVVEIDETQIIDGVYPEQFIEFNAYKPVGEEDYWEDGAPFEWYIEDENLISPEVLKEEYIVTYEPKMQYIDIKYYTDEVDENDYNLIASDTWAIKINDWAFGESFQVIDELPNSYVNKYKPVNCGSGALVDSEKWYTFDDLVTQGHLDILYMTKEEPHDPDDDSFPEKVLFWYHDIRAVSNGNNASNIIPVTGAGSHLWQIHNGDTYPWEDSLAVHNVKIPWMNLGYTPKEIGRLAIQVKAYALADSAWDGKYGENFGPITDDYTYFLGYRGAPSIDNIFKSIGYDNGKDALFGRYGHTKNYNVYSTQSASSTGWFAFRGHIPKASGFSKQWTGFTTVDGNNNWEWSNAAQVFTNDKHGFYENNKTLIGGFRLGKYASQDENLEWYIENQDHIYKWIKREDKNHIPYEFSNSYFIDFPHDAVGWSNALDWSWHGLDGINRTNDLFYQEGYWGYESENSEPIFPIAHGDVYHVLPSAEDYIWHDFYPATIFNPTTMLIDAYHNYVEIYDLNNDQNPIYYNIDTSNDYDLFTDRCKPKGPIRLFTTTNPDTGLPNINTYGSIPVRTWTKNYRETITSIEGDNKDEEDEEQEQGSQNQPGTSYSPEFHDELLEMAYNPYTTQGINCPWINLRYNAVPGLMRAAIWGIKIWDRGKLVRDLIPVAQGDQIYDYIAPFNGLFDKVTEIFFGPENKGGDYEIHGYIFDQQTASYVAAPTERYSISAADVSPLYVKNDPTSYGKMVVNYYDYDNSFLGNKWVRVPTDYEYTNINFKDLLAFNDYKPSIYYHDGMLDTDTGLETDIPKRARFHQLWEAGSVNVYYKQKQYTKTIVYYNENTRIASKDFFFSQHEIEEANTLADLGIDPELYRSDEFGPGVVMSDETIIASDDVAAFIDAPSPIVVYHKYTKEERPDLLYVEYYRGGAYEEEGQESIVLNSDNKNYLDCDLSAVVLNPNGLIKYVNHYHSALYEDEEMPYFIAYQVDVNANYVPIHKGPARAYTLLAHITDRGRYTIIEERNGWGRLKEYPKGWILLSYTSPIVGPGQNPDYDIPTIANVTIPFGTRLSITKMTIDRMWAYTPEYDSWIKTEEISFDQQGRLYSALDMKVIHLDRLDWTNISSLADMGIDVQQYKLRFHNNSSYTYNGAYTQEALSDVHSIDIVYPEIIYPYVVKYYLNTVDENNILGRGGFSCSLSDWNPDWDTFLATSYLEGYNGHTKSEGTFYRTVGKTESIYISAQEDIYILRNGLYNDINCYYAVWGGYVGYIPTSIVEVDDSTIHTISPILYRDKPLTLTWDFYGLNKNLYKPDYSYSDGIMLWNPHTYDNKILDFTFEELIATGSQKVLYIPQVDLEYKAIFDAGFYRLNTDITDFNLFPTDENPGTWDIEIKYQQSSFDPIKNDNFNRQLLNEIKKANQTLAQSGAYLKGVEAYIDSNGTHGASYKNNYVDGINIFGPTRYLYNNKHFVLGQTNNSTSNIYNYYATTYMEGGSDNYYNIINVSNKRPYKQAIVQKYGKGAWESNISIIPRTKVKNSSDEDSDILDLSYLHIGSGVPDNHWASGRNVYQILQTSKAAYYYIKVWHNFELIHYYIAMPQGYWMPNGEQAPNNGFYDLITQQFTNTFSKFSESTVYTNNNEPSVGKGDYFDTYDYFVDWSYDTENIDYTIRTNQDITIYRHPDTLSEQNGTIEKNTEIPVKILTQDQLHHVQGVWYFIDSGWIQADKCSIIDTLPVTNFNQLVALKGDESNAIETHYGYIRPNGAIEAEIPTNYLTLTSITQSIPTSIIYASTCQEIEMKVSGKLAPMSSTSYTNVSNGYLIGSNEFNLRANILKASTTRTDVIYNIKLVKNENGNAFIVYIDGVESSTISINSKTQSRPIYMGCLDNYGNGNRYLGGQANVNYHDIKITLTSGEIHHMYPVLVYNTDTQAYEIKLRRDLQVEEGLPITQSTYMPLCVSKSYGGISGGWDSPKESGTIYPAGDFSPVADFVPPIGEINTFTTEKISRVYYSYNDFYWDGKIWIPAAYTDQFKVIWDQPKTYVVQVSNIYTYQYPLINTTYRVNNLLLGDRFTGIGHLGKDNLWILTEDGYWVYNNDTFTELES